MALVLIFLNLPNRRYVKTAATWRSSCLPAGWFGCFSFTLVRFSAITTFMRIRYIPCSLQRGSRILPHLLLTSCENEIIWDLAASATRGWTPLPFCTIFSALERLAPWKSYIRLELSSRPRHHASKNLWNCLHIPPLDFVLLSQDGRPRHGLYYSARPSSRVHSPITTDASWITGPLQWLGNYRRTRPLR